MSSSGKPAVAVVVPRSVYVEMFRPQDLELLAQHARVTGPFDKKDDDALRAALSEAVAAIGGWGTPKFERQLLDCAPRLKLLAYSAGSVKHIVGDEFFDRGLRITTSASANAVPVAQFTVGMMVTMLKQVPWLATAMARCDGDEVRRRMAQVRELQDMRIGLVGASRVGCEVIRLLKNYPGLDILVSDPYLTPAAAANLGVRLASLEEVSGCEVVSVHAPLLPETIGMFDARILGLLPDHAVFINTSRGALVNEEALIAQMQRRPIYAALDVTFPEPPAADSPLRREPNILLTPHIAGAMRQAKRDMGRLAIDQVIRFLRGESLTCEVTREMLPTQA